MPVSGSIGQWTAIMMRAERRYTWFVDNVQKYHRTVATYFNTLMENGLTIRRVLEPQAQPEYLADRAGSVR